MRAHYSSLGVPVLEDADQYSTDFTKCLNYLRAHASEIVSQNQAQPQTQTHSSLNTLILGGLGGRVDQAFSQIHHLYTMTQEIQQQQREQAVSASAPGSVSGQEGHLYLVSEESITFILRPGKNVIRTPGTNRPFAAGDPQTERDHFLEENVGIIPLSGPARITTSGLEWDVTDWATEIGGQLSTSNHIRADVVEVESRVPVLFTLELAMRFKRAR